MNKPEYYLKVCAQLKELLYTKTTWFIVNELEGYSDLRGTTLLTSGEAVYLISGRQVLLQPIC